MGILIIRGKHMEKYFHFDRNKTLQELEGEDWGNHEFDSHLVVTCHELRKIPVGSFGIEDLRIMIGQNFSLDYLIPLALETLDDDIYADGDFYCGDLLNAVLRVELNFWNKNPRYKSDLENIIAKNIKELEDLLTAFRERF
jgi:hypothetical protein